MIVLDTSTLVSAAFRKSGIPAQAVQRALATSQVATSPETMSELLDVFDRPNLARFLDARLRAEIIDELNSNGVPFQLVQRVMDCRDPDDNKFLELALAAKADLIFSSDSDLLALHPWRGIRILRPAEYLAEATA